MDQMLVLTVLYSQALRRRRQSRHWRDDFSRGFETSLIARLLQPLRLDAGRRPSSATDLTQAKLS